MQQATSQVTEPGKRQYEKPHCDNQAVYVKDGITPEAILVMIIVLAAYHITAMITIMPTISTFGKRHKRKQNGYYKKNQHGAGKTV